MRNNCVQGIVPTDASNERREVGVTIMNEQIIIRTFCPKFYKFQCDRNIWMWSCGKTSQKVNN